ncbi:unnamed protein product [Tenebrio molitor]|nr:unnamed protein product [Tenebrio molitor]
MMGLVLTNALDSNDMFLHQMHNYTGNVIEKYNYVFYDLGDPRVKNWAPISSPLPTLFLIGIYLLLVYVVLPRHMATKNPYSLKTVIYYYNIFQIVACATLIYKIVTPLTEPSYVIKCEHFSYSLSTRSMKRLTLSYYFYFIKVIELVETLMFILRKKYNQVSPLHVYHHVSTLALAWFFARYYAGGLASFSMMLNSSIHVLMYSYYFISSLGQFWQKKINKWKPIITVLQMVQFFILVAHASQVLFNENCGLPNLTFYIYGFNIVVNFYMFGKFFKQNYLQSNKGHKKN